MANNCNKKGKCLKGGIIQKPVNKPTVESLHILDLFNNNNSKVWLLNDGEPWLLNNGTPWLLDK